jgi:hypothetical protein
MRALLLHASAWPTLVFGARTFSNSLEATLLALSLAAALGGRADADGACRRPQVVCGLLGGLLALGCWVRFTFGIYALPVCVLSVFAPPTAPHAAPTTALRRCAALLGCAVASSALLLAVDCRLSATACSSSHCSSSPPCMSAPWRCVAPLNAAMYHSSPSRVASAHGRHPRLTHALLNLPFMAGPLALVGAIELARAIQAAVRDRTAATRAMCTRRHDALLQPRACWLDVRVSAARLGMRGLRAHLPAGSSLTDARGSPLHCACTSGGLARPCTIAPASLRRVQTPRRTQELRLRAHHVLGCRVACAAPSSPRSSCLSPSSL